MASFVMAAMLLARWPCSTFSEAGCCTRASRMSGPPARCSLSPLPWRLLASHHDSRSFHPISGVSWRWRSAVWLYLRGRRVDPTRGTSPYSAPCSPVLVVIWRAVRGSVRRSFSSLSGRAGPPGVRLTRGLLRRGGRRHLRPCSHPGVVRSSISSAIRRHDRFEHDRDAPAARGRLLVVDPAESVLRIAPFPEIHEEFRTGAGIVDLVITYATTALSYGLVGADCSGVFASLIWRAFREARSRRAGTAIIRCFAPLSGGVPSWAHDGDHRDHELSTRPASVAWSLAGLTAAHLSFGVGGPAPTADAFAAPSPSPCRTSMQEFPSTAAVADDEAHSLASEREGTLLGTIACAIRRQETSSPFSRPVAASAGSSTRAAGRSSSPVSIWIATP